MVYLYYYHKNYFTSIAVPPGVPLAKIGLKKKKNVTYHIPTTNYIQMSSHFVDRF